MINIELWNFTAPGRAYTTSKLSNSFLYGYIYHVAVVIKIHKSSDRQE